MEKRWYSQAGVLLFLIPLELLFIGISWLRKRGQLRNCYQPKIPLVVVGNISVGGTGKTPLLISLVKSLQENGYKPAVISRGYGSRAENAPTPVLVNEQSSYLDVGDEPLEIFLRTSCVVVVNKNRVAAVKTIEDSTDCNVILSDDGLQHYSLGRHIEILAIDGTRGWGNGHRLPVGPLRESIRRAASVDFRLCSAVDGEALRERVKLSNSEMLFAEVQAVRISHIQSGKSYPIEHIKSLKPVVAVAGIGNPEKFFKVLRGFCGDFSTRVFTDHHKFSPNDFNGLENSQVVMTGKDAVKCKSFAGDNFWFLEVEVIPETKFFNQFYEGLKNIKL